MTSRSFVSARRSPASSHPSSLSFVFRISEMTKRWGRARECLQLAFRALRKNGHRGRRMLQCGRTEARDGSSVTASARREDKHLAGISDVQVAVTIEAESEAVSQLRSAYDVNVG